MDANMMNEDEMNDEQFLAQQMQLAQIEGEPGMEMDDYVPEDEFEVGAMNANVPQNQPLVNHMPDRFGIQDGNARQVDNQPRDRANNPPVNLAGGAGNLPDNNHADNRGAEVVNNQDGNQAGNQGNIRPDNPIVHQGNEQANNQGVGRGIQVHLQVPYQARNPTAANNGNRAYIQPNVGFGNFVQPHPYAQQGVLQAYPQGHAVYGHQRGSNVNQMNFSGPRHQRLLTPVEAARASRLRGIINNLEFQIQKNREIYKRLYGPGGLNHDAGYWKNRFFQEKKRNSNKGKNLYFFHNK